MVAIATSVKGTRPSVARAVFTRVTLHTTFCAQIGGKSRIAYERVVSRGQSSIGEYEHFTIVHCATRGKKIYFASVKFDARAKRG